MSFKIRHDKKLVTVFSITSLAIFVSLVALIVVNNNLFKSRVYFYTKLKTADGLGKNMPVMFKGYEIGRVKNYTLNEQNEIIIKFFVYKEFYSKMHFYSVVVNDFNPISNKITKFELVNPLPQYQTNKVYEEDTYVPGLESETGKEFVSHGYIQYETRGVAGIIKQVNSILDKIINNQTPEKLNEVVANLAKLLEASKETIASYNSKEGGEGSKILIQTLNDVRTSVLYVRQTLKELHRNRKDLSPLIISTTKTLDKAQDTLDGLNNNPLLKGGIPERRPASLEVEISD